MGRSDFSTVVTRELTIIARGDFYQNMYRMVYEQVRINGLGTKAKVEATPQAAHGFAVRTVREHHPGC